MTDFIIETSQLCKSYKDKPALRGLDLQVPAGSSLVSLAATVRAQPEV
jgi:hypothetical protein